MCTADPTGRMPLAASLPCQHRAHESPAGSCTTLGREEDERLTQVSAGAPTSKAPCRYRFLI